MAIVCSFEPATKWRYAGEHGTQKETSPVTCDVCGMQMYAWSTQRYSSKKNTCFSQTCAEPTPIAMIRGDVAGYTKRESGIDGYPYVHYPKADGYSSALREAVKQQLTSWGFTKIAFIEPDGENNTERHTVITGVHVSPKVNVTYRTAPKMQRTFVFDNKFGQVSVEIGFHESHEKHYQGWHTAFYAVREYNKNIGNDTVGSTKVALTILGQEGLQKQAEAEILASRQAAVISEIQANLNKIASLREDIKYYEKQMSGQKAKYQSEFGEPAPKLKGEE